MASYIARRKFLATLGGAAAWPLAARAQAYPSRPVRIIVPFAPAGASDITARLIGQWLSERLGQQFVIENRPGGGGNIGTEAVVRAPADGYTLLMVGSANASNATFYDKLNFNFIRDIAPVGSVVPGYEPQGETSWGRICEHTPRRRQRGVPEVQSEMSANRCQFAPPRPGAVSRLLFRCNPNLCILKVAVGVARPLSVSAYTPLSRSRAMNPRMAMDCIAWSMMPTEPWLIPVATQNKITRSCALSFVVGFSMI